MNTTIPVEQYKLLIAEFDNQDKAAKALKVTQPTVSNWIRGKCSMKPSTALLAERITSGKFKASDLSPELAELAAAS